MLFYEIAYVLYSIDIALHFLSMDFFVWIQKSHSEIACHIFSSHNLSFLALLKMIEAVTEGAVPRCS